MLAIAIKTKLRRFAAAGTLCLVACGPVTAGWFCSSGAYNRPYYDPSNEPNWGVEETTWRQFSSQSNFSPGSYCATGQCQSGVSAQYGDVAIPMQMAPATSMQGALIQQAPMQQPRVIQQPQMLQIPQAMPSQPQGQVLQIPNQQNSIYTPPAMTPYSPPSGAVPLDNSGMRGGYNAGPKMAPQPQPLTAPLPQYNDGSIPAPGSTLNPVPGTQMHNPGNPVPVPQHGGNNTMGLPPTTQLNHYQSPFHQAAPRNYIASPAPNYGNQQQAANPTQPISFQSNQFPIQQTQPAPSRNPFKTISRFWQRNR